MTSSRGKREFRTKFSLTLKGLRTERGFTQRHLAEEMSNPGMELTYSATNISSWETSRHAPPDPSVVRVIVGVLGLTRGQSNSLLIAIDQDAHDANEAFRGFQPFGSDSPEDRLSATGHSASLKVETDYSIVVVTQIKLLVDVVYAHLEFDSEGVQQATAHLLALRDELLNLEADDAVLDFETQNALKRLIQDVSERAPWAREQLFSLLRHPVIAGAIGAGIQRYLLS